MSGVLLRADGSTHLGMGHIMRCLAVLEGLRARQIPAVLATRAIEPRVIDMIQSHGVESVAMKPEASETDEFMLMHELIQQRNLRAIVTDVCHRWALAQQPIVEAYHQRLRAEGVVIVLAGGTAVDMPCDLLVNPYVRSSSPTFPTDGGPRRLLGPLYFIVRQEFLRAAQASRAIAAQGRRVLVTVGGSDELRFTVTIVKALQEIATPDLDVRIVIGLAYPADLQTEVQKALTGFVGRATLLTQVEDMAEQFMWADLAIIGDGLTKYEAAVTGTPSLMLSRFDSEHELNDEFVRAGTTLHVGDGSAIVIPTLAAHIRRVLDDNALRTAMSQCGKMLIDGRGLERVLDAMLPEVLQ